MGSAPKTLDKKDMVKGISAFLWNLGSLVAVLAVAILALPVEDLPAWLLWIVPIAPFVNAVAYTFKKWVDDNRGK